MTVRTTQDESVVFRGLLSSRSLRVASLRLAELKEMQRLEQEEECLVEATQCLARSRTEVERVRQLVKAETAVKLVACAPRIGFSNASQLSLDPSDLSGLLRGLGSQATPHRDCGLTTSTLLADEWRARVNNESQRRHARVHAGADTDAHRRRIEELVAETRQLEGALSKAIRARADECEVPL